MKLKNVNINEIPDVRRGRDYKKIVHTVLEFMDSDAQAVEVLFDANEYKSVKRGVAVIRQASARRSLTDTVAVVCRGDRVFLVKLVGLA